MDPSVYIHYCKFHTIPKGDRKIGDIFVRIAGCHDCDESFPGLDRYWFVWSDPNEEEDEIGNETVSTCEEV
jgi:hypothetical protein